ncbi:hypothetical protein AAG607_09725 [Citromicrobium bathyomarinum]|nr:hypothetical protein [Citromicrobium sp.]|tara:strand:- start:468 stop:611 length:144 start_codon:yes stop_codon:yes gene_type:complete
MEFSIVTVIVALIVVAIAWKVLSGIFKTLALLAILAVAAFVVFGVMA